MKTDSFLVKLPLLVGVITGGATWLAVVFFLVQGVFLKPLQPEVYLQQIQTQAPKDWFGERVKACREVWKKYPYCFLPSTYRPSPSPRPTIGPQPTTSPRLPDREACQRGGGIWREYGEEIGGVRYCGNNCTSSCDRYELGVLCTMECSSFCDCRPNRCWDRDKGYCRPVSR